MIFRSSILASAALAAVSFCSCSPGGEEVRQAPDPLEFPEGPIEIVLDADMYNEVDDQFAFAYAMRSERIEVKAVCAAPFKNRRSTSPREGMEKSYEETLRLLELLDHPSGQFAFKGSDRFLPDRSTPVESEAARRIIELAHQDREGRLFVVGLGVATDIASALLLDPSIKERIVVLWIGGHPYHWDHARDFNLRQDIAAVQVLLDSGVPFWQVPAGEVARALTITLPELERGLKGKSVIGDFLLSNVEEYYREVADEKPRSGPGAWDKVIWDIATIAWLSQGESLVRSQIVEAPVLTGEGTWREQPGRHPVRVAVSLDREAIFQDLFTSLAR